MKLLLVPSVLLLNPKISAEKVLDIFSARIFHLNDYKKKYYLSDFPNCDAAGTQVLPALKQLWRTSGTG
jgi:hypothetical protein